MRPKNIVSLSASLLLALLLMAGCGTVSSIQTNNPQTRIDAKKYSVILVRDFKNGVTDFAAKDKAEQEKISSACAYFADLIADELRNSKAFAKVSRKPAEGEEGLEISGVITRYEPGNPNLRLWVGFGAGSSYFSAQVDFTESKSQLAVGRLNADKNSWALGGAIAASQTVEGYMQAAASKVASELTGKKLK